MYTKYYIPYTMYYGVTYLYIGKAAVIGLLFGLPVSDLSPNTTVVSILHEGSLTVLTDRDLHAAPPNL